LETSVHDHDKLVWAFGGGKGGAGRTLLSTTLGILLAKEGRDVVIFDGDLECANAHTALGMRQPQKTLADFTSGKTHDINEIAVPTPFRNLRLISSAGDCISSASPSSSSAKNRLIRQIGSIACSHLFADIGPGLGFWPVDIFLEGDIQVLVITPEPTAVETAYHFIRMLVYRKITNLLGDPKLEEAVKAEFTSMGTSGLGNVMEKALEIISAANQPAVDRITKSIGEMELKLVVNQTLDRHDKHIGPAICEIVNKFYGIRIDYAGFIPFDERVALSLRRGRPFIAEYETSETAACFSVTLRELLNSAAARSRKRQLNFMTS
jgi:flagellar biosynthesis protein FlhG